MAGRAGVDPAPGKPSPERVFAFYMALWDACRTLASGDLERALARELTDVRLDVPGVRVMLALLEGEQRITDLAETLAAAAPNISRAVRQLEEHELVERVLSPEGRNRVHIRHTPQGRTVAEHLWRRMFEELLTRVEGWTETELAEGERLLSRLAGRQGRAGRADRPPRSTTARKNPEG